MRYNWVFLTIRLFHRTHTNISQNIIQIIPNILPKDIKMHSIIAFKSINPKYYWELIITIDMIFIVYFVFEELVYTCAITYLFLKFFVWGIYEWCCVTIGAQSCQLLCSNSFFFDEFIEIFIKEMIIDEFWYTVTWQILLQWLQKLMKLIMSLIIKVYIFLRIFWWRYRYRNLIILILPLIISPILLIINKLNLIPTVIVHLRQNIQNLRSNILILHIHTA